MRRRVVVIGDLSNRPGRDELLCLLEQDCPSIDWEWLKPETPAFNLPKGPFNHILATLRDKNKTDKIPIIVKLYHMHGRDQNTLYRACPDPVEAPRRLSDVDELARWILSSEAGIVQEKVWELPVRAAALIAILSKLIRNKSWNKYSQGHQWTKEVDLLRQAPVHRADGLFQDEAHKLLSKANPLLFSKGGSQGKTPLGWCIQILYLPVVKQAISTSSLAPLRQTESLRDFMSFVDDDRDKGAKVVVDSKIVSERIRCICREQYRDARQT